MVETSETSLVLYKNKFFIVPMEYEYRLKDYKPIKKIMLDEVIYLPFPLNKIIFL
jgi:hypothetical protein